MNRLLLKILWSKQSPFQLIFTLIALVIGVLVMILTINLYLNFKDLLSNNDTLSNNYLVVNKSVGYLNTFGISSTTFDSEELKDIKNSGLVKDAEGFTANQFDVIVRKGAPFNLYFELFFESLPKKYLDQTPNAFRWKEGDEVVPILLSNEIYNLFNFGFTPTKANMPQLPKSVWLNTTFDLEIRGSSSKSMKIQVVGFSDRINSVMVPQEFLIWANKQVGRNQKGEYSRVILEVDDAADPALAKYLEENGYVTNKDRLLSGSGKTKIKLLLSVLGLIGVLIVILTLNTLVMNIQLLVSKAKTELKMLFCLGYRLNTLFSYMFLGFLFLQLLPLIFVFTLFPMVNNLLENGLKDFLPSLQLQTYTEVFALPFSVFFISISVMALFLKRFLRLGVLAD